MEFNRDRGNALLGRELGPKLIHSLNKFQAVLEDNDLEILLHSN
jgi:hypothetical protein